MSDLTRRDAMTMAAAAVVSLAIPAPTFAGGGVIQPRNDFPLVGEIPSNAEWPKYVCGCEECHPEFYQF